MSPKSYFDQYSRDAEYVGVITIVTNYIILDYKLIYVFEMKIPIYHHISEYFYLS